MTQFVSSHSLSLKSMLTSSYLLLGIVGGLFLRLARHNAVCFPHGSYPCCICCPANFLDSFTVIIFHEEYKTVPHYAVFAVQLSVYSHSVHTCPLASCPQTHLHSNCYTNNVGTSKLIIQSNKQTFVLYTILP
jgi:hypothetical protein